MKTIGPLELDPTGTRIRQAEIEASEAAPFRPRRDVARMEIDSVETAREIVRAVNDYPTMKAALECVIVTLEQNKNFPADVAYALSVCRDALGLPVVKPKRDYRNPVSGHEIDCACSDCAKATPEQIRAVIREREAQS
jgi:hypothetical protein